MSDSDVITLVGGLLSALPNLAVALVFLLLFVRGDVVSRSVVEDICEDSRAEVLAAIREWRRADGIPAGELGDGVPERRSPRRSQGRKLGPGSD